MHAKYFRIVNVTAIACFALFAYSGHAQSQTKGYPDKPVRMLIGYPPGGASDFLARAVAQRLTETWGKQVVVENRPGGSTIIASEMTSKAPPDGYTLMLITVTHAINAGIFNKLPYNTVTDFQPVAFVAKAPNVLLVHPSLPVKSVKELTALAKANPGKLNYGSTGNSSPYQIAGEMYKMMTGTDIVHVPYKGAGPALTALLSGEVTVMFGQVVSAIPHIRSGRMRALAVTTEKRAAVLPDLPTMAEAGLKGYAFTSWFGIIGPKGMSPDLVTKLNTDVSQALKSPEVNTRIQRDGAELEYMTPEKFSEHIQAEIQRLTKVIKAGNITAE